MGNTQLIFLFLFGIFHSLVAGDPSFQVVREVPHSTASFTQGLALSGDTLIESTGSPGRGTRVLLLDAHSGKELKERTPEVSYFGEGVALAGSTLYQLSWRAQIITLFHFPSLQEVGRLPFTGEGWGLTNYLDTFFVSNGSDTLFTYDREFKTLRKCAVTYRGKPVDQLNELEYVKGEIFANRWYSDTIYVIDPTNGVVVRVYDMTALTQRARQYKDGSVLNGIAYDPEGELFYITGKFWPTIYVVQFNE